MLAHGRVSEAGKHALVVQGDLFSEEKLFQEPLDQWSQLRVLTANPGGSF